MGAWQGSKATSGLCQPLTAATPPHATYIEAHLGAARSCSANRLPCAYEVELVHGCCHRILSEFPFAGDELVYSAPLPARCPQIAAPLPL